MMTPATSPRGFVETRDADGPVAVDLTEKRGFHVIFVVKMTVDRSGDR